MEGDDKEVIDLTSVEPSQDAMPALIRPVPQDELSPIQSDKIMSVTGQAPANIHEYPSLYDTKATSVLAIVMGIMIVAGVQVGLARIFATSKTEHHALTHFVTAMVGLVLGVYVCDMLIAGPTTELLAEQERITILAFIKDTCLMVFAYYFGTRAIPPDDNIGADKSDPKAGGTGG